MGSGQSFCLGADIGILESDLEKCLESDLEKQK